jgi:hypothetical protein
MKFHLLAGSLLLISGFLVYLLLFGLHSDLQSARVKIQKESVKSLREEKKVQAQDKFAPYINKTLVNPEPKPSLQKAEASEISDPTPPSIQPPLEERKDDEKNYWCRPVPVRVETNPVKCVYPDACYGCNGPIIRPEYEGAVPLCADGTNSQLYHVECCPNFSRGNLECPSNEACFQAENPPNDFCSCNDQPECRLVDIGGKIQCACIQN